MRQWRTAKTAAVLCCFALVGLPVSAQNDEVDDDRAQRVGDVEVTVGVESRLADGNITNSRSASTLELAHLQYLSLTDFDDAALEVVPELAESWERSANGRQVTYTLVPDAMWSDGVPVTAADVAYTVNRSARERWELHNAFTVGLTAEALDDRTVVVKSLLRNPVFPSLPVPIVPQHVFEQFPNPADLRGWDGFPAVGAGPFVLESIAENGSWNVVAHEGWSGWSVAGPRIDRIVFDHIETRDLTIDALESGRLDVATDVEPAFFERLDAGRNIEAIAGVSGAFIELGINNGASGFGDGHPALLDVRVRRALARGIDRDLLVEDVLDGLGIAQDRVPFSSLPQWKSEISRSNQDGFDPEGARGLLSLAGFRDTDDDGIVEDPSTGAPLALRYVGRAESPTEPLLGSFLREQLRAIGIDLNIDTLGDEELREVQISGEYDLYGGRRAGGLDPARVPFLFLCAQLTSEGEAGRFNPTHYCNPAFDELYVAMRTELDVDARRELVRELSQLLYDDVATVVLFEELELQAYRIDRLNGWTNQPASVGPVIFNQSARTYANLVLVPPTQFSGSDLLGGGLGADDEAGPEIDRTGGSDTPNGSDDAGPPTVSADSNEGYGVPWIWIVGAIGLLALLAAIVLRVVARRSSGEPHADGSDGSMEPLPPPAVSPPAGEALPPPTMSSDLPPPTAD